MTLLRACTMPLLLFFGVLSSPFVQAGQDEQQQENPHNQKGESAYYRQQGQNGPRAQQQRHQGQQVQQQESRQRAQQSRQQVHQGPQRQPQNTQQQARAVHLQEDQRGWGQRGGYGGYLIPEDHFRTYFGSPHRFRIRNQPVMMMGYQRLQYGGYSFLVAGPWPEYWPDDWYRSDDVYVDYNNGYYMHDRRSPGIALAIAAVPSPRKQRRGSFRKTGG
jgi:hypothetical protein